MKLLKINIILTFIFIFVLLLNSCGSTTNDNNNNNSNNENSTILVAYFSATGHTKKLAEEVSNHFNADLYEIEPKEKYTTADLDYSNSSSRSSMENSNDDARPEIKTNVSNIEKYDTIILAYPIWWGKAPKIVYTFLESYDFSNKTIVPFCTSASSPLGSSANILKTLVSNKATWLDGKRFSSSTNPSEVCKWLDSLNLTK